MHACRRPPLSARAAPYAICHIHALRRRAVQETAPERGAFLARVTPTITLLSANLRSLAVTVMVPPARTWPEGITAEVAHR